MLRNLIPVFALLTVCVASLCPADDWRPAEVPLATRWAKYVSPDFGELFLRIHHDEDAEVYLNGRLVAQRPGYVGEYGLVTLDRAARASLRLGENVLAVHCYQSEGGQYIDVGLVLVTGR